MRYEMPSGCIKWVVTRIASEARGDRCSTHQRRREGRIVNAKLMGILQCVSHSHRIAFSKLVFESWRQALLVRNCDSTGSFICNFFMTGKRRKQQLDWKSAKNWLAEIRSKFTQ